MACELVGYHGTTQECAKLIIENNTFKESNSNDDWLGTGIYFYSELTNAIDYNIRKYKEKKFLLTYNNLVNKYSVIKCDIVCEKGYILDLNTFENKSKLIIASRLLSEKIKKADNYDKLEYRDGLIINLMRQHTHFIDNYKIITNIFSKQFIKKSSDEIKDGQKRKKSSRISFEIKQLYICVIDVNCIHNINLYNNNYENEYNVITKIYKDVRRGGDALWILQN